MRGRILLLIAASIFLVVGHGFSQTVEICNDGKDNNGDGIIDCADAQCIFPANIEKGCRCFDAVDNDGDGKIDPADTDCASYYGLTFVGAGSTCSIQPPAGTGFSSIAPPQTSSQNTADTPAKIVVGDMNNDGMPDVVITSKWNSTVQVVATTTIGGFSAGDIMSDFRTPGSGIFPLAGSKYVFEHEALIADINKDKIGELYVIASERGGSPNNKPVRFFLCGFKYAVGSLVPLFNAVDLGPDRPGSPGIADFDGDGKGEVYLKNRIYAAESGVLLADPGGNWDRLVNSGPVAVNILGDSKLELVCGPIIYSVPSLASRTLQVLAVAKDMNTLGITYYPKGFLDLNEFGVDQASTTSTADFDGDGFIDVLMTGAINCSGNEAAPCANSITTIFYWNVNNNTVKTFTPSDPTYPNGWIWGTGRINLGDANGDSKLEALFVAGTQLFCLGLDAGGNFTQLWVRTINDALSGILSLTVYDFNNDGKPEVVYRDTQELAVVDGLTGATKIWSASCKSHTFTEGPVIADVNGDGNTDICVPCYTNDAVFDITKSTPQQQSLGQTRLFYSSTNAWLPTRKVWNQHGYFVTNINDNLTLPFPQMDPSLIFSNAPCPNGLPGPQRPLNLFMNQVPRLSQSGCPEFPAPDLTYFGDDPATPGVDTNGDGVYTPTVVITPPICGDLAIKASFNIINNGDLPISDNVPVSFFNGDPTANPVTATRLFNTTLTITNLQVGQTLSTPTLTFNGPGTTFPLYIVIYNDGSVLPISLVGQSTKECSITNNMYTVIITPDPFTVTVEKLADDFKCANSAPDNGQLRVHIFKGATEVVDYSPYTFQWYTGITTASPIAAPQGTQYNLIDIADGTYSVVVTNTQKGCKSALISGTVARLGNDPPIQVNLVSHQTVCNPPNGELLAIITDGTIGYTFTWFDVALNPLGISGPNAKNLTAGNYIVQVSKNGCTKLSPQTTVNGPQVPDAQAITLQNVVDCSNPNTGSIQADAYFNGVLQNPANYTFDWYFYNNATSTRGSILPPIYGTGQIRTGLPVGYYQATIKDNATQCLSGQSPIAQVQSQTVIPDPPQITQLAPQTSCDPSKPNGSLIADAYVGGVLQNPSGFTFQWFKGQNTLPANLVATVSGTNGQQVNQVAGGGIPYTVKIITPFNCFATAEFTIAEVINVPVITLVQLTPNSVCDIAKATNPYNGSIQATVTFGASSVTLPDNNYIFTWYNGPTVTDPVIPVADSKNPILTGLKDGSYTAIVQRTDLFCTSVPKTQTVVKATILPVLSATSTGSNNCDPALTPDGTVTVSVTNPVAGDVFGYQWYSGNAVFAPNALGAANNGLTATAIKVGGPVGAPNPYTVLVSNKTTGCENNTTQFVADNSVIPVLSFASIVPNSICSPATSFNGSLTAQVDNIPAGYTIADYLFKWYDGNSNAAPVDPTSTSALLNKLDAGFYTVDGKNTKTGCQSAPITNQVPNAKIFPTLVPTSTGSHNCDPAKTPDGTASVSISNIQPGDVFTYQWYTGNAVGVGPLGGANNGTSATAIKVGGPVGAPNPYTVLVTNTTSGCTNFTTSSVPDNSIVPILSLTPADNSICNAALGFNGSISTSFIDTNGAADPHTYVWSTGITMVSPIAGQTGSTLTGRNGGFYTATTTNTVLGCTSSPVTTEIQNNQVLPAISAVPTPSTNCPGGADNGVVVATVTNAGANTFSFAWHKGNLITDPPVASANASPNSTISNQQGGKNYTVEVTNDQTGCKNPFTQILADNSILPTFTLPTTPNTKCVPNPNYDGTATVTGLTDPNAVGPDTYTITFHGGNSTAAAVVQSSAAVLLNNQNKGFVTVTVTNDRLNCKSSAVTSEILETLTNPTITTSVFNSTNCAGGNPNGSSNVTSVAPADTYEYRWYAGIAVGAPGAFINGTLATTGITGKQGGPAVNFIVEVTLTSTGCKGTETVGIQDDSKLPLISPLDFTPNTNCTAPFNGTAFVDAVTPFTYRGSTITSYAGFTLTWSAGTVGPADKITALGAGMYTLQVTANNNPVTSNNDNCISNLATVNIVDALTLPVVSTTILNNQTSCDPALPNGQIEASETSGLGAYTFNWFNGIGTGGAAVTQVGGFPGRTTQNLASADYTVEVTNNNTRCVSTVSTFLPDNIVIPGLSYINVNPVTVCRPNPNGSATASLTNISTFPGTDFTIFYDTTFTGGSFPTDPAVIKGSPTTTYSSTSAVGPGNPPAYGNLWPGYLTAVVTDNNTHCDSNPATVQIIDNIAANNIVINGTTAAGFCGGAGGAIDVTVAGGSGAQNFEWWKGTPVNSNINFFNNLPDMTGSVSQKAGAVDHVIAEDLGPPSTPILGVGPGPYTLIVTDAAGCGAFFVQNVPFTGAPTITITTADATKCDPGPFDGAINVNVVGTLGVPYRVILYNGNNSGTGTINNGPVTTLTTATLNTSLLKYGDYLVQVTDMTQAACPLEFQETLIQKAFNPLITINQVDPNTACDAAAFADGKVSLTVNKDVLDTTVPNYSITSINPVPIGFAAPFAVVAGVATPLIPGFGPNSYDVTVTDANSGCFSLSNVTIPDQPAIPQLINVVTTDDSFCAPNTNGKIEVTSVTPVAIPDYQYTWYTDAALTAQIYQANGTGAGGGELLDATKYAAWVSPTAGLGIGTQTYYVRGERLPGTGPGAGCPTPAVQAVVQDLHVTPDMTLTSLPNTSCDPIVFEGSISINALTNSGVPAVSGSTYTYVLDPFGVPVTHITRPGLSPLEFTSLLENTYTIRATNEVSGCKVESNNTVASTKFSLAITNFTTQDKLMCNPDGAINVTEVKIDRAVTSQSMLTYAPAVVPTLSNNFDFRWFSGAPGTFASALALKDAANVFIPGEVLTDGAGAGQYPTMGAGTFYVVAKRKTTGDAPVVGAGCETPAVQVNITDKHVNPLSTLVPFSNTSCSAAFEGEIDATVNDASVTIPVLTPYTFTYAWTTTSTTTPVLANPYNAGTNTFTALENGDYTLTATNNQTGCAVTANTTIIKNATPIFITASNVVPKYYCDVSGNILITQVQYQDRAGAIQTPPVGNFTFAWTQPSGAAVPAVNTPNLDSVNFATIAAGVYQVVATRSVGSPGAGCSSAPVNIEIKDKTLNPVIALTPFSNTACTIAFEGEIRVDVTDPSKAKVPPVAFNYDYTWTDPNASGLTLPAPNPDPGKNGIANLYTNLQEGTYGLTVRNNVTGCTMVAITTILKNATPVITQLVTPTDQVLCSADGKLVVNEVRVIDRNGNIKSSLIDFPITDFDFTYSRTTQANTLPGITAAQLDNANYPAIGADIYFVMATRVNGTPGAGCSSAPYKVDIVNKQIFPVPSLTPLANTSCDPNFFEGEIKVNVADGSVNLPAPLPGAPYLFNYTWTASASPITLPVGTTTLNNDGDGFGGGENDGVGIDNDGDHLKLLRDGAYTVSVTNTQTSCVSTGTTTIFKNSTPVFTQLVTPTPQVLCSADGMLVVNEVKVIDRNGTVQSNLTGDFPLSDFLFNYDRTTIGNTVLGSSAATQLDNTNYPGIGFDSYYVVATRTTGGPGRTCSSAPYKVDILDRRLFPKVDFTSVANSSCNVAKPNGSVTANASEQNGTNTDPYTFTWVLNSAPLAMPPSTQTDTNNSSVIGNALDGTYVVTATNTATSCPIDASFNLLLDQTRSTPNIIDVITVDPIDCNPSASATVTKITLGSTFNSTTQPPNIPPDNTVTGPQLATFIYEWAFGNPSNVIAGQTAPNILGLVSGSYFVSVQDPSTDCQSGPKEVDILDDNIVYPVVNITQTALQISCISTTGTAALAGTADGQNSTNLNYLFTWYNSLDLTGPSIPGSNSTISNLINGNYSLNVKNNTTGCSGSALYIVPDDSPLFTPELSAVGVPLTFCVGLDGNVQARVIPNPSYPFPYNYSADLYFSANPNLANPPDVSPVPNVPGFALNFEQSNLTFGFYTFKVTDNNTGCFETATAEVVDDRTPPVIAIVEDNPMTNCDPAIANGQLSATADGNQVGGYTFGWFSGSAVPNPPSPIQTNNKLIGEPAGPYTVRVTNNFTGCFGDLTGNVTDATVTPIVPTAIVLFDRTNCIAPNGWVTANVAGTTLNYLFNWYDGPAVKSTPDFSGVDYQDRDVGPYSVTATDAITRCVSPPAIATVKDMRVIPEFTFDATPSYCQDTGKPKGAGSILLLLSTPNIVLDDIKWFDVASGAQVGIGPQVFELFPGFYRAEAVTVEGCKNEGTAEVVTEISPYNGVSVNGDSQNDSFIIDCISNFPNNNVKIFNRVGILIYEANGYDNLITAFRGVGEKGIYQGGRELPDGTYFYIIDKRNGSKPLSGFLELIR